MDYIGYEKEATRNYIKDLYAGMLAFGIEDNVLKAPLREFTYEKKRTFARNGALVSPNNNLAFLVHKYIHKFNVEVDKDITLEDALNAI